MSTPDTQDKCPAPDVQLSRQAAEGMVKHANRRGRPMTRFQCGDHWHVISQARLMAVAEARLQEMAEGISKRHVPIQPERILTAVDGEHVARLIMGKGRMP